MLEGQADGAEDYVWNAAVVLKERKIVSVFGYLERPRREYSRSVIVAALEGQEAQEAASVEVVKPEVYPTVDEYDPVLRSHCRL